MNKIAKSILSLALAATLSAGAAMTSLAYQPEETKITADMLNALGLFKGTENGYELDKPLTRMEALIMLIRLSGSETEALYGSEEYTHPFTDAPDWEDAGKYLGYAYEKGLTLGATETTFEPEARADLQMYITFALRALGYADTDEATVWDTWETLASSAGLLSEDVDRENFLRGDAVLISRAALDATVNGDDATLKDTLSEVGAFNPLALAIAEVLEGKEVTADSPLIDILGKIYAGVDTVPAGRLMTGEISADRQAYYIGVDAETLPLAEGIFSEPMMTATAHSVCLIRVKDGADIEQAKKDILEKVDPRKWICVGVASHNVRVESIGNLILLVMDNHAPDELTFNFRSMDPTLVHPDENGMLLVDGAYIEADEAFNPTSVSGFAEKLNTLRSELFAENKVYYATIPEKSYFVRDSVLDYLNHTAITGQLSEELYDWNTIDLAAALSLDDYYSTDRHWRQEKLFPVVKQLGDAMGFTVDEAGFEAHTFETFTGAYKDAVADIPAESLVWLTSKATENAVVDNFQNPEFTGVYEEAKLESKIPYDIFLSGATPLTVIENPDMTEKRELVIFRDSYGSSIAPLLIGSYSKITLVDLRYMASNLLPEYVDFTDAEVLFLFSDKVVNNSTMLK